MMDNEIWSNTERLRGKSRILELLPRYYEEFGENPKYTSIDLYEVDGHEVAWMEFTGITYDDDPKADCQVIAYKGYELRCECDLTEGVGWKIEADGTITSYHPVDCECKKIAVQKRHAELRSEYVLAGVGPESSVEDLEGVIADLLQRGIDHEFIEGTDSANFWGGQFYLETVASITGAPLVTIYEAAKKLEEESAIVLEGAVVADLESWINSSRERYLTLLKDGWSVVACLVDYPQGKKWDVTVFNPDGAEVSIGIPKNSMEYIPTTAVDIDDLSRIQRAMVSIVEYLEQRRIS